MSPFDGLGRGVASSGGVLLSRQGVLAESQRLRRELQGVLGALLRWEGGSDEAE